MSASNSNVHVHGDAPDNYLTHAHGLKSWFFSLDHKRIGLMYMIFVLSAFALGGMFAVLIRTELWYNHPWLFGAGNTEAWRNQTEIFYNNMFSLHGAVMVFMFIIPSIPAILGNFILPLQLGAKDVAFPRLNLLSLWVYMTGALFFTYILLGGVIHALGLHIAGHPIYLPGAPGLDTGWTFYTPYSTHAGDAEGTIPATMGAFILGFSSILTGVNFVATIHTLRPKGMTWFRMPLFLWAMYSTSVIQILATPVLAITLLLLICERTLGIGIFDPSLGGDPILYQHFFWFYSHPAVYIMILPAMGVISELISVHCRKHIFGYNFIAVSSIALALLGFLVWGHHLFVSGQSPLANSIFSLLTFSVAIPSAVKVFNWLGTMYKASIRLTTPMLYAMGFILLFTIGGLTGLFLGALAVDLQLHDTYFVIAHFHYVAMGSTLFAFLGGIYHWFPKITGRMYNEKVGRAGAIIIFIGFNLTFFPLFVGGAHGAPRRWATYPIEYMPYHRMATCGAYLMTSGLILAGLNWWHGAVKGRKAPANPWGGNTLEWRCPSPPPHDNFPTPPGPVADPYDMNGWEFVSPEEGWVVKPDYVPVTTH